MTTAARPRLAVAPFQSTPWVPWAIVGADVLALETAFALGFVLRQVLASWFTAEIHVDQYLAVALGILLLPVINYQIGLYPGYLLGPVERLRRRTLATLAVFGGLVAWDNIVARGVLSRGVLLATCLFALLLPPLVETAVRQILIRKRRWGIPVVMIGSGATGQMLARLLEREPELGLVPIAFVDRYWNQQYEAEAAIVSLADLGNQDTASLLHNLSFPRVIVVPDVPGIASLWVTARDLGGYLGLEIKKNLLVRRNHALKRIMDQLVAIPLFLLSIPVIVVAAVWIKLSSRGPVFYCQRREGVDVWKLRTMQLEGDRLLDAWFEQHPADQAHWQRHFKLRHDPRVIPVIGRLLRRTSLDELPQLWAVLKGEMSLVGPRPLPDYHVSQFSPEFRTLRTRVLPGLTGLWQVSARGDGDIDVQQTLDTYYIRNWSPWLDLYILARTVAAVLLARGAY